MELYIKDRIYLLSILPPTGTFKEFILKKDLIKRIGLTEQDKKFYRIETEDDNTKWDIDIDKNNPLKVTFSQSDIEYLKKTIESISEIEHSDDMWVSIERIYNECI